MRQFIQSGLVVSLLSTALGLNGYLYFEREDIGESIQKLDRGIKQKQILINRANHLPEASSKVSHRLALPSNRLSVGTDFQQLSKSLHLARLDFQISPETKVTDAFQESTVELKFMHHSDTPLFRMISHVLDDFPGLVYPLEIVIWREPSEGKPIINGRFRFQWLKTNEKDEL